MSSTLQSNPCEQSAQVSAYVMQALPPDEAAAVEAHIASCAQCRPELETLRPVADTFVFWPTDVLRPSASLARAPRAPDRGGDRREPRRAAATSMGRTGVGGGCAGNLLQADGDRYGEASCEHARATLAGRRVSASHACRPGGIVAPRWRTVDRRPQALPRRLQPGRGWFRRQASMERDRLHLRAHHQYSGHARNLNNVSVRELVWSGAVRRNVRVTIVGPSVARVV